MALRDFVRLLRPQQWYKNLLVFLPIIFVGQMLDQGGLWLTFLGFVALCLVSSANYVINDIVDVRKDRAHPEKRRRPIAAGRISVPAAIVFAVILLAAGVWLSLRLDAWFLYSAVFLFAVTQLYSFWLKREAFADIIVIGINFVIRAIAGTFIIKVVISPWLVLCTFFFALFLVTGKRHSDALLLGKAAKSHKETLAIYNKDVTSTLMIIATVMLVASYSFYAVLGEHKYIALTIPFALYAIFRYFGFIYSGSQIARHPELIIKDWRMLAAIACWAAVAFLAIYGWPF